MQNVYSIVKNFILKNTAGIEENLENKHRTIMQ